MSFFRGCSVTCEADVYGWEDGCYRRAIWFGLDGSQRIGGWNVEESKVHLPEKGGGKVAGDTRRRRRKEGKGAESLAKEGIE